MPLQFQAIWKIITLLVGESVEVLCDDVIKLLSVQQLPAEHSCKTPPPSADIISVRICVSVRVLMHVQVFAVCNCLNCFHLPPVHSISGLVGALLVALCCF